jgi:hypothetical protein
MIELENSVLYHYYSHFDSRLAASVFYLTHPHTSHPTVSPMYLHPSYIPHYYTEIQHTDTNYLLVRELE